jgi:hypothetical protein
MKITMRIIKSTMEIMITIIGIIIIIIIVVIAINFVNLNIRDKFEMV